MVRDSPSKPKRQASAQVLNLCEQGPGRQRAVNGTASVRVAKLISLGGQHFHFCRFRKGEPFAQAQARYEHFLAASIGLKPGMKVLDIGCGVGGPARELAHFAGCDIVGLNNHQYQLFRASEDVRADGLRERVTFQKGDFTKLGAYFAENTFDAGALVLSL